MAPSRFVSTPGPTSNPPISVQELLALRSAQHKAYATPHSPGQDSFSTFSSVVPQSTGQPYHAHSYDSPLAPGTAFSNYSESVYSPSLAPLGSPTAAESVCSQGTGEGTAEGGSRSSMQSGTASNTSHYSPVIVEATREVVNVGLGLGKWTDAPEQDATPSAQSISNPQLPAPRTPTATSTLASEKLRPIAPELGEEFDIPEPEGPTVPGLGRMRSFLGPKVTRHGAAPWGEECEFEDDTSGGMVEAVTVGGFSERKLMGKKSLGRLVVPFPASVVSPAPSPKTATPTPTSGLGPTGDSVSSFLDLSEDPYARRSTRATTQSVSSVSSSVLSASASSRPHTPASTVSMTPSSRKTSTEAPPMPSRRAPSAPGERRLTISTSSSGSKTRPSSPVRSDRIEPPLPSSASSRGQSNSPSPTGYFVAKPASCKLRPSGSGGTPGTSPLMPRSPSGGSTSTVGLATGTTTPASSWAGSPLPSPNATPGAWNKEPMPQPQQFQGLNLISLQAARDQRDTLEKDRLRKQSADSGAASSSRPSGSISISSSADDIAMSSSGSPLSVVGSLPPMSNPGKTLKSKKSGFLKSLKKAVGVGLMTVGGGGKAMVSGPVGGVVVRNGGADPLPPTHALQAMDPNLVLSQKSPCVPSFAINAPHADMGSANGGLAGSSGAKVGFLTAPASDPDLRVRRGRNNQPSLNLRPVSMAFSAGFSAELMAQQAADEDAEAARNMASPVMSPSLPSPSASSMWKGVQTAQGNDAYSSSNLSAPATPATTAGSLSPTFHRHDTLPVSAPAAQSQFSSRSPKCSGTPEAMLDEIASAKKAWGVQMWELERQANSLKKEIEALRGERDDLACGGGSGVSSDGSRTSPLRGQPCDKCGCNGSCSGKQSVLDRPRVKASVGGGLLFGGGRDYN